ncbi:MAG TPA: hypothetical protein VHN74_04005 [Candidatus Angelobacter sp.]|jgi:hypothetical protein|nr:hypothetical protein [Candidatus Angelobacter sp.]
MPANAEIFPALPRLTPDLASTEVFSFYVSNWNSFIHIACADANIKWTEE